MKLIDLLVRELPGKGGWPHDADTCAYGNAGSRERVHFARGTLGLMCDFSPSIFCAYGASEDCLWIGEEIILDERPEDSPIITREQYEAALAAPKKVEWDGEGVPPVGVECEFNDGINPWTVGVIKYTSNHSIVIELKAPESDGDIEPTFRPSIVTFRPILTDEERKKEEVVNTLAEIISGHMTTEDIALAKQIYKAIAQGKVEGLKLSD